MSFSRAGLKRFNDVKGCAPPVGAYDPKHQDANAGAVGFDKTDRFRASKEMGPPSFDLSNVSSISSTSCVSTASMQTVNKKLFHCSTPNLSVQEKKSKQTECTKSADNSKIKELEKEIKKLLQERVEQDKTLQKIEDSLMKLDGKLHHSLSEKSSLQAKVATLEKQLIDVQKANDVLTNKALHTDSSVKKQESLQSEINKLGSQVEAKESESTELRQAVDRAVNELLDCIYQSLHTASALKEKHQNAELTENNLGILEKLKAANHRVKYEIEKTVSQNEEEWGSKYNCLSEEKNQLSATLTAARTNLLSSEEARKLLEETRESLSDQIKTLDETVASVETEKNTLEEKIQHLKDCLAVEKERRVSDSQVAFESSAEKAQFEETIEQLEECNEEMNKNIRLMTEKYHDLESVLAEEQRCNESERNKLETQLQLFKSDHEKAKQEVEGLQQKHKDYIEMMNQERSVCDQSERSLEEKLSDGKTREDHLQSEINELTTQLSKLSAELDTYKQQLEDNQRKESELSQLIEVLEKEVSKLKLQLSEIQQYAILEKEDLLSKLEDTKQKYQQLQQQHDSYVTGSEETVSRLETQLTDEEKKKEELTLQINTLKFDVTQLSLDGEAYQQLQQHFNRYKEEVTEKEDELLKELDEAVMSKTVLEESCVTLEQTVRTLREEEEVVLGEREALSSEVERVQSERDTLCTANLDLHTKLSTCEEARDECQSDNIELRRDLEDVDKHRVTLLNEKVELEDRVLCLCEERDELKAEADSLAEKLESLAAMKNRLDEKCSQLEAEQSDQGTEHEELVKSSKELQVEFCQSIEVRQKLSDMVVHVENLLEKTQTELVNIQKENSSEKTEVEDLRLERNKLKAELEYAKAETFVLAERLENLKRKLENIDELTSEISSLQTKLDQITEEKKSVLSDSSQLEKTTKKLKAENEELKKEKENLSADLALSNQDIETMKEEFAKLDQNNACSSEEREKLLTANATLETELEDSKVEVIKILENCEQMEQRLVYSVKERQELTSLIQQSEKDCSHRIREEEEKLSQVRDQYEDQVGVLREQLELSIPSDEAQQLQAELERWKMMYEDLSTKVEPFLEQINGYEMEKQALLGRNRDAQKEVDKLSQNYAKLLGHQNHKQKIKHLIKIKEENNSLKQELSKTREQLAQSRRRSSSQLVETRLHTQVVKPKFDPSKAFVHSKENLPQTPVQKLTADQSDSRPRPSPLANSNARFHSPLQSSFGQRL